MTELQLTTSLRHSEKLLAIGCAVEAALNSPE